jgi:hypothetical protein
MQSTGKHGDNLQTMPFESCTWPRQEGVTGFSHAATSESGMVQIQLTPTENGTKNQECNALGQQILPHPGLDIRASIPTFDASKEPITYPPHIAHVAYLGQNQLPDAVPAASTLVDDPFHDDWPHW